LSLSQKDVQFGSGGSFRATRGLIVSLSAAGLYQQEIRINAWHPSLLWPCSLGFSAGVAKAFSESNSALGSVPGSCSRRREFGVTDDKWARSREWTENTKRDRNVSLRPKWWWRCTAFCLKAL